MNQPASATLRPQHILLVEDDIGLAELFEQGLAVTGLTFQRVESGRAALAWLAANPDCLLLLDYSLPDMTAQALLETLTKSGTVPPFIIITGHGDERVAVNMMKLGARDYLVKDTGLLERLPGVVWRILREVENERRLTDTEAKLRHSRVEWENIFQAIGQPTVILDVKHGLTAANQLFLKAAGKTLEEVQGLKCWQIFHGPGVTEPCVDCPYELTWQSGHQELGEVELEVLHGTFLVSCTPIKNAAGQIEKVIHIATDITELKRLQQHLMQAHKMETIGQLAGGVAHDFNNILQTILGYSEMLLKDMPPTHEYYKDLTEIHRGGERAAALTRQLLAFSRRQMLMPRVLNLNDIVTNLTKMLTRLLGENVRLSLELAPHLSQVEVDAGQMEQVVMNLAVNARDAMPKGGQIVIRTTDITLVEADVALHPDGRAGHFVCLAVADNGVGMTAEVQRQIFEPFFTTKGLGKGTGMGLATVYGIIKQHGGWITVYSELGLGSTFKIYLPAAAAAAEAPAAVAAAPLPRGHGESILLIEDEPHVRRLAQQFLTQAGYRVVAAGSCAEAHAANDNLFDLVVSDVVLPDGNGLDLMQQFKAQCPGLRCVLSSGYADIHQRWPEIAERSWAFLMKPFSQEALLRAVATALTRE